jgi:hypothetical protein
MLLQKKILVAFIILIGASVKSEDQNVTSFELRKLNLLCKIAGYHSALFNTFQSCLT